MLTWHPEADLDAVLSHCTLCSQLLALVVSPVTHTSCPASFTCVLQELEEMEEDGPQGAAGKKGKKKKVLAGAWLLSVSCLLCQSPAALESGAASLLVAGQRVPRQHAALITR